MVFKTSNISDACTVVSTLPQNIVPSKSSSFKDPKITELVFPSCENAESKASSFYPSYKNVESFAQIQAYNINTEESLYNHYCPNYRENITFTPTGTNQKLLEAEETNRALRDWYSYAFAGHTLSSCKLSYLIREKNDQGIEKRIFKFTIVDYYTNPSAASVIRGNPANYTLQYSLLPQTQ